MNIFMRFVLYFIRKLTAAVVIIVLIMFAAFMGYDYANIYVNVKEGISQRAEVILKEGDYTILSKFYTQDYLEKDSMLSDNPYVSFIVTNYNTRVKIKKINVWPWNDVAKVVIEEVVKDINAAPKDSEEESLAIPQWENGEKLVVMKKNGRWRIDRIIMTNPIQIDEAKNQE